MNYDAFSKNMLDVHNGLGYTDNDLKIDLSKAISDTTVLSPKKTWDKTVINISESEDVKLGNIVLENGFTGILNKSFYKNLSVTGFDSSQCDSLKYIGAAVFKGDTSLVNVKLNEGLELIESEAFSDCISMGYIFIPKSIKMIDKSAFSNSGVRVMACNDDKYEMIKGLKNLNFISKIISFDENYLINNIDSLQSKMNDRYDLVATKSISEVLNYLVKKNPENAKNEKVISLVNNMGRKNAGELLNSIRTKGLNGKPDIKNENPVL